jgi:hypothetical protein
VRGRAWRWVIAVLVASVAGVWQERSGPTYPVRGAVTLGGEMVRLELERTHDTGSAQPVTVTAPDRNVTGEVAWRRYPTNEAFHREPLRRENDRLVAYLPAQPAAGKIEYQVRLEREGDVALFPPRPAVTRFKGTVPTRILLPHVLLMFVGLVFAARAGIEALRRDGEMGRPARTALAFFLVGGFGLGPLVQHHAFGQWWAGVPYGWDLTDNKMLVLAGAWLAVVWACRGGRRARAVTLAATIVTLGIFAIPHSAWGSQLDWNKVPPVPHAAVGGQSP